MNPFRASTVLLFALALMAGCGDDDKKPTAPAANPNRVWVESQTVSPGDTAHVQIKIRNAEAVWAIQVTLQFTGTGCTVDSVCFGDVLPAQIADATWRDYDPEPLRVNMISTTLLPLNPGEEWLFATIDVCIAPDAEAQEIVIDDYSYIAESDGDMILHHVTFLTIEGLQPKEIYPEFVSGKITVAVP